MPLFNNTYTLTDEELLAGKEATLVENMLNINF